MLRYVSLSSPTRQVARSKSATRITARSFSPSGSSPHRPLVQPSTERFREKIAQCSGTEPSHSTPESLYAGYFGNLLVLSLPSPCGPTAAPLFKFVPDKFVMPRVLLSSA